MIVGGHFTFDLGPRQLHGADWIVLELTDDGFEETYSEAFKPYLVKK